MGDMQPFQTVESDLPSHIGRMLQFNSTLKSLDISKIMLRDEGIEVVVDHLLRFNRSLANLTVSGNKITMEGAKALGKLLAQGSTLAKLVVSSNTLGDEGGVAIAEALQYNSGLESLEMTSCGMADEGLAALADSLSRTSLYSFHAWGNRFGTMATSRFADLVERHAYLKDLDFLIHQVDGKLEAAAVPVV